MAQLILQKAQKIFKPLKVFLYGPTFSGKTLSSLKLAVGVVQAIRNCTETEAYEHILLIDTEYGRGALYGKEGLYNYFQITAPYTTTKLTDVIDQVNLMPEIDVVIVDSLSHFWIKKGGILDLKAAADKQGGNSYTNWQEYTAMFNSMIDTLLESPKHMFFTARAKSDTVLVENEKGKMVPKTFGLKPEIRDGFEYECDITLNIDKDTHRIIVEKGIVGMAPSYDIATPELGKDWYDLHKLDSKVLPRTQEELVTSIRSLSQMDRTLIQFVQLKLSGRKLEQLSLEEITALESEVIAEFKKNQVKH